MERDSWRCHCRHPGALQCCAVDTMTPPHLFEVLGPMTDNATLCIELHAPSLRTYIDAAPISASDSIGLWTP